MASRDPIQRMSATIHDGRMGVGHNEGRGQRAIGTISMTDPQSSYLPEYGPNFFASQTKPMVVSGTTRFPGSTSTVAPL
jgi:hypothetical protein